MFSGERQTLPSVVPHVIEPAPRAELMPPRPCRTGMNIESFCLLSSLSFAIEYTPRRAAVNRRKPPAPQRAGIFPLAKRREKNACFSHSEARLPSPEEPSEAARASADVPQIGTRKTTFYIVPAPFMGTGLADFEIVFAKQRSRKNVLAPHLPPRQSASCVCDGHIPQKPLNSHLERENRQTLIGLGL